MNITPLKKVFIYLHIYRNTSTYIECDSGRLYHYTKMLTVVMELELWYLPLTCLYFKFFSMRNICIICIILS